MPDARVSPRPALPGGLEQSTQPTHRVVRPEPKRYLFVVSRDIGSPDARMFAAMRRDMLQGSVELIVDRRAGDRRSRDARVDDDRRSSSDRRQADLARQVAAAGWIRLEID